jgi:hypothetical protein
MADTRRIFLRSRAAIAAGVGGDSAPLAQASEQRRPAAFAAEGSRTNPIMPGTGEGA